MKKQFWVEFGFILISLLLVSCASLKQNSEIVVDTALNLANKQIELNQFDNAINTYNMALNEGNDYRLLYNKSLLLAKMEDFKNAIITAKVGYNLYPDRTEFLKAIALYCYKDNQFEEFLTSYEEYLRKNDKDVDSKIELIKLCNEAGKTELAYEKALNLWESGIDRKEIVSILYSINPEEWQVLNRVLH